MSVVTCIGTYVNGFGYFHKVKIFMNIELYMYLSRNFHHLKIRDHSTEFVVHVTQLLAMHYMCDHRCIPGVYPWSCTFFNFHLMTYLYLATTLSKTF